MTWARHGQHHVLPNCGREHASFSSELTPSLPSKVSRPRLLQSEKWGFFPKLENLDLWPVKCSTIWKRGNDMWWKRISIANRTFPKLYHTQITNCRRFSGGHIAQVAFLPLEIWGESPPSPRGIPIIGLRKNMRACWCSAIYNPEPRVLEGTLASQRGVTWIVNFEVLQNHNKLDRRSWLLWLIAKTIHNDANILANNTSTLLWATFKKEFSPKTNLVKKYKDISKFSTVATPAPSMNGFWY